MTEMLIFAVVALLLLFALLWLSREIRAPRPIRAGSKQLAIEDLFPLHCRHFPQVMQALSPSDTDYLIARVSSKTRRRVLAERRVVVRQFLGGLREDFRRLDQLGRSIAAYSPEVSHAREAERIWLALRFALLCRRVELRLLFHTVSLPLLKQVADMVGAQAAQLEAAMARLEGLSLSNQRISFSA